jgi:hypothetical protein
MNINLYKIPLINITWQCSGAGELPAAVVPRFDLPKKGKYGVMANFKLVDGEVRSVTYWDYREVII